MMRIAGGIEMANSVKMAGSGMYSRCRQEFEKADMIRGRQTHSFEIKTERCRQIQAYLTSLVHQAVRSGVWKSCGNRALRCDPFGMIGELSQRTGRGTGNQGCELAVELHALGKQGIMPRTRLLVVDNLAHFRKPGQVLCVNMTGKKQRAGLFQVPAVPGGIAVSQTSYTDQAFGIQRIVGLLREIAPPVVVCVYGVALQGRCQRVKQCVRTQQRQVENRPWFGISIVSYQRIGGAGFFVGINNKGGVEDIVVGYFRRSGAGDLVRGKGGGADG